MKCIIPFFVSFPSSSDWTDYTFLNECSLFRSPSAFVQLMASTDTQSTIKRSIKPKTQYSPSEPSIIALYHLINNDDTRTMMIVANSSVKKITNDGAVVLNDNRTAKLIMSGENLRVRQNDEHGLTESCCLCHLGPKAKCLERWNRQKGLSQCE